MWAFRAEAPLHDPKLYTSPGPINTDIGLLMTGNMLQDLMSLISNCIEPMYVEVYGYGYGEKRMNPWNLYVSRGLFKLLEVL